MVQLSLDPFDTIAPAITLDVPLIGIIFVSVLIGIVIGGLTGLGQAKKRRAKARKAAERAAIRSSANLPAALDSLNWQDDKYEPGADSALLWCYKPRHQAG